jgi:hypothetical protein
MPALQLFYFFALYNLSAYQLTSEQDARTT